MTEPKRLDMTIRRRELDEATAELFRLMQDWQGAALEFRAERDAALAVLRQVVDAWTQHGGITGAMDAARRLLAGNGAPPPLNVGLYCGGCGRIVSRLSSTNGASARCDGCNGAGA